MKTGINIDKSEVDSNEADRDYIIERGMDFFPKENLQSYKWILSSTLKDTMRGEIII